MIFGSSLWLWLSLGIVVPIFIHLWNKKAQKPRLLGTYRFLPEESRAAAHRIEPHEIPLLLVRIGMVLLVVLLLAELFWQKNSEVVNSISIQEVTESNRNGLSDESGTTILQIPTKEINIHGWWNILEQVEHDYFPESISINGELTQNRFKGNRPHSNVSVSWNQVDSLQNNNKILASWKGVDGNAKALSQLRIEDAVKTEISDVEQKDASSAESITLILNSENKESINTGLKYAAEVLSIPVETRAMSNLAIVQVGDRSFNLVQNISKNDVQEMVEPNKWAGVSFHISELDTEQGFVESLMNTVSGKTFLGTNTSDELVVNGEVDPNLESWVYAGIGNALLLHSLKVEESLCPMMADEQVAVNKSTRLNKSVLKSHSAKNWLFGLLLLFWIIERIMAPRRGM